MKKVLRISTTKVILLLSTIALINACSLEEDVYSIYTPDNFYENETQILSSLSGVYRSYSNNMRMGAQYRTAELSADQVIVHGKIQGWWFNTSFNQLQEHTWTPAHGYINGTWNSFFQTVGQTNALIASLEAKADDNLIGPIAELRALRAYAYFNLMDLFGNVPIFTDPKVDPLNLPTQNTRSQVFDFVVKELEEAALDLPSKANTPDSYYGRLTQEAAYGILAQTYINAKVFTGTAQNSKAVEYCDKIINSGNYSLLADYHANFAHDNDNNDEFIFGALFAPEIPGGLGHPLVQKVLPGIQGGLFGLPYTPQNGFGTRKSVYDMYEDGDDRKDMFIYYGNLVDPRDGSVVMVERIVPDHNSNLYVEGSSTEGPVPYEIIPATDNKLQPMNAGIKWIKWGIDPGTQGGNAGNDIAFIRYAEILLIKAEALFRDGNAGDALTLVNQVRLRSNATALSSITLDDICDERGRELAFEGHRRKDLIRFGKFGNAWEFKNASSSHLEVYPIPDKALNANPNLNQNPGY